MKIGITDIPTTLDETIAALQDVSEQIVQMRRMNFQVADMGLLNAQHGVLVQRIDRMARDAFRTTGATEFAGGVSVSVQERVDCVIGQYPTTEHMQWVFEHARDAVEIDWSMVEQAIVAMPRDQWPSWAREAEPYVAVRIPGRY
jgi:hypothetical protein